MPQRSIQTGQAGDIPISADFDGTGNHQFAVFRPSNGTWYINSNTRNDWSQSSTRAVQCGKAGDIPVAADYFGEGKVRIAVFRPSNGTWYINGSNHADWAHNSNNVVVQCGKEGDIPVPKDYFGQGKARIAVFRPSNGTWYINGAALADWAKCNDHSAVQCGKEGDVPVAADYFGEGKARIAVFRPSNGTWYINGANSADWAHNSNNVVVQCGKDGDIPVPADYHGEGKVRIAVFRPSNGTWYVNGSNTASWAQNQGNHQIQCGATGDVPLLKQKRGRPVKLVAWRPSGGHFHVKAKGLASW